MVNRKGLIFEGRDRELKKDIMMDAPKITNEDFRIKEKFFVPGDLLPRGSRKDPVP